ncbi:MAG: 1-(5-phosphoribosyl)-5-[(5-phosphoribosylamino)methylideneamino]imidazole-4-carboxamide isomerase [Candidatus Coproplasma sp.]
MKIFPAIDIIQGEVVRLKEGDYGKIKKYSVTPLESALNFAECGAKYLHVVDLDGAKSGNADNAKTIEQIVAKCNMFVEVGGGIRTFEQIQKYIDCGVKRVILGTIAVKDYSFVEKALEKFGGVVAVGVDALNERVAINGWVDKTEINSLEFCERLKNSGVTNVIYTDISKDGMMSGTNLEIYNVLCQAKYPKITASGGISSIKEVEILNEMGIYAAILGKSLYEGAIDLKQAIKVAGD